MSQAKQKTSIKPTMLLVTVVFWILLNSYFLGRYIQAVHAQPVWTGKVTAVIVVLWIVLTSFYASFHLVSFLFSLGVRRLGKGPVRDYSEIPPIAILYPCMNDMREDAIETCLAQEYPNYALYVLDDSSDSTERERVDALRDRYGERVTIIRRECRDGFKAGNLNNALRQIGNQYKYVCVLDSDELIPPTFLREMVAIAEGDDNLGFVQAAHHQYGETNFGKQTGDGVNLHWDYFLPARNRFGFVYSYGHGVLWRSRALMEIGGFPEVVSEDIAASTKLREAGYRGYYAHHINGFEETPPSYQAFRRRNRKIVSGTLEFLYKFYPAFFRADGVSLVEKIDLLITVSVIYLPILFIGFLFVLYGVMPLLGVVEVGTVYLRNSAYAFEPLQRVDFVVFLFFTVFSSLCYILPTAVRSPDKAGLYILKMGAIYLSASLQTIGAALQWLLARQASFVATRDRSLHRTHPSLVEYVESLLGLGMMIVGLLAESPCLVAVGLALSLVPILVKKNLDGKLIPLLIASPMLLTLAALLGMPALLVSATGMFAGLGLIYH